MLKVDWKTMVIKVMDVELDPKNVRLDIDDLSQNAIILDLFASENVMQLVEKIVEDGLHTHNLPIITKENGRWIVLEGNRRFAALKAILNPELVPQQEKKLKVLVKEMGDISNLAEIEVKVAPNRADASKVIASIHTEHTQRKWSLLRQAYFYYAQIVEGGKTVEQLQEQYKNVDIPAFIKRWEIHHTLKSINYGDEEMQRKVASKRFPISIMERLYNDRKFMELAKMSFDNYGHLTITASDEECEKLFKKIIKDIYSDRLNTRVINKRNSEYIDEIKDLGIKGGSPVKKASSLKEQVLPKKRKSRSAGVVPKDITCTIGYPAIERMLNELQGLNYNRYPNAVHDLLRSFLECSLKAYFDYKGIVVPSKNGQFVQLREVLKTAREHFKTEKQDFVSSIDKVLNKNTYNDYTYSLAYLNAINHNENVFSKEKEVKDAWDNIENLIRYILAPPTSKQ